MSNLSYHIMTFGCQMNHSDSERLSTLLESYGYKPTNDPLGASLLVFNTCSIKQKAEDKVLGQMKLVNHVKDKNPGALAAITGCMTRVTSSRLSKKRDPLLAQLKEIDFVFQIKDLAKVGGLIKESSPAISINEISEAELDNYFKIQPKYSNNFQAYIPIMTGCDKFCTYCIVPYSRGRETSRPIDEVYKEAATLVEKGYLEITLLGQNVNSFGLSWKDKKSGIFNYELGNPFVQLLRKLDTIEGLVRLRFTSPHPQDMTHEAIDTIAFSRTLKPYIHLPLQSGSDSVLKRMNRNYDRAKFLDIVEYIREKMPDASISTDIIVGFCGETSEEHMESLEFFKKIGFDLAYISQFSARKGTAADMLMKDDVDRKEKARRWHEMNEALRESSRGRCKYFVGKKAQVLVEKFDENTGMVIGRSEHYKEVHFKGDESMIGKFIPVQVKKAFDWVLHAEIA